MMAAPEFGIQPRAEANMKPVGYAQVVGIAAAIDPPVGGRVLMLNPETQAIRIRDDGTDPTTTVGLLIPAGACYEYKGDTRKLRIIEAAASSTLNVLGYD
jgi:hypothetical protein